MRFFQRCVKRFWRCPRQKHLSLWHRVCYVRSRSMVRVTRLLIVMALAGTPVSVLACELWCVDLMVADRHPAAMCHDGETNHDGWQESSSSVGSCHGDAAMLPFRTEDRRPEFRISPQPAGTLESSGLTLFVGFSARTRWKVFRAQPPGAPVSHTVLRI